MGEIKEKTESKKSKKRRRRRKKHPILRLLIFLLIIAGAVYFLRSEFFSVRSIEVEGNKYYTLSQVQELSGIETGKNIFFETKTGTARDKLLESPYIKRATVTRKLPNTIKIVIEERTEFAAIQTAEGYILIDEEGMVLGRSSTDPELPLMEGIELTEAAEDGKPLKAKQSYILNGTLDLIKKINENDLFFRRIYFSSAVVRAYIYDDYYCEGTPENITENLPAIKELISRHFQENINKGVIKVGSGGYLSFNPKID